MKSCRSVPFAKFLVLAFGTIAVTLVVHKVSYSRRHYFIVEDNQVGVTVNGIDLQKDWIDLDKDQELQSPNTGNSKSETSNKRFSPSDSDRRKVVQSPTYSKRPDKIQGEPSWTSKKYQQTRASPNTGHFKFKTTHKGRGLSFADRQEVVHSPVHSKLKLPEVQYDPSVSSNKYHSTKKIQSPVSGSSKAKRSKQRSGRSLPKRKKAARDRANKKSKHPSKKIKKNQRTKKLQNPKTESHKSTIAKNRSDKPFSNRPEVHQISEPLDIQDDQFMETDAISNEMTDEEEHVFQEFQGDVDEHFKINGKSKSESTNVVLSGDKQKEPEGRNPNQIFADSAGTPSKFLKRVPKSKALSGMENPDQVRETVLSVNHDGNLEEDHLVKKNHHEVKVRGKTSEENRLVNSLQEVNLQGMTSEENSSMKKTKQKVKVQGKASQENRLANSHQQVKVQGNASEGNRLPNKSHKQVKVQVEMTQDECRKDLKFDIVKVTESFNICHEDLDLHAYIKAYKELNRFFHLMGTVFGFVASDIDEKIGIMEKLAKSETGNFYKNFESMMEYEKSHKLMTKTGFVNGCRTILRLHRALEFISGFMFQLSKAKFGDGTASLAQETYKKTLARYHPWLLQKGGTVAMYALPPKGALVSKVLSERCMKDQGKINRMMKEMAHSAMNVYKKTQLLYEKHGLLNLS